MAHSSESSEISREWDDEEFNQNEEILSGNTTTTSPLNLWSTIVKKPEIRDKYVMYFRIVDFFSQSAMRRKKPRLDDSAGSTASEPEPIEMQKYHIECLLCNKIILGSIGSTFGMRNHLKVRKRNNKDSSFLSYTFNSCFADRTQD